LNLNDFSRKNPKRIIPINGDKLEQIMLILLNSIEFLVDQFLKEREVFFEEKDYEKQVHVLRVDNH